MSMTIKTHFNPCFWIALWNFEYYKKFISGNPLPTARKAKIYSLDFDANKILLQKAEALHYEKWLGIAAVDMEDLNDMIHNSKPNENLKFIQEEDDGEIYNDAGYFIEVEKKISAIENTEAYSSVLDLVKTGKILSFKHKIEVIYFLFFQQLRSSETFRTLVESHNRMKNPKLEALRAFSDLVSNPVYAYNYINSLVHGDLSLYCLNEFLLPIGEVGIFEFDNKMWAILSPKHLLSIDAACLSNRINYFNSIPKKLLAKLYVEVIMRADKSILFGEESLLKIFRESFHWEIRSDNLRR